MSDSTLPVFHVEQFPEEFFVDLAIGVSSFTEICDNYEVPPAVAAQLESDPVFQRRLRMATQVVEDTGEAFRSRCRVVVSNNVQNIANMMRDNDVPASTQLDAFKTLVKFGGLEPTRDAATGPTGPQLVLNIVAPDGTTHAIGGTQPRTITAEPVEDAEFTELEVLPPAASSLFGAG